MFILWIGLGFLVYYLFKNNHIDIGKQISTKQKSAEEILNERYAKGEIDEASYITMKKHLKD